MSETQTAPSFEWREIYKDGFVHLPGFIMCAAATFLITKISSLLSPFSLYFSFTELVRSGEGGYGFLPFLVKLFIPFIVGVAYFHRLKNRDATLAPKGEHHKINVELTAAAGTAFGALLLSWPAIVLWEFIVNPTIFSYRIQFYFVYFLYIASFAYVTCAGVIAARLVWIQGATRDEYRQRLKSQYQIVLIVWTLIFALATGGFAEWASGHIAG